MEIEAVSLKELAKREWIHYLTAFKRKNLWEYISVRFVSTRKWVIGKRKVWLKYISPSDIRKIEEYFQLLKNENSLKMPQGKND